MIAALTLVKWAGFLLATAGIAYVSRASLAVPGSHGFYRFFAWEAILGLGLLNADVWFRDPLSPGPAACWPWPQPCSWWRPPASKRRRTSASWARRIGNTGNKPRGSSHFYSEETQWTRF